MIFICYEHILIGICSIFSDWSWENYRGDFRMPRGENAEWLKFSYWINQFTSLIYHMSNKRGEWLTDFPSDRWCNLFKLSWNHHSKFNQNSIKIHEKLNWNFIIQKNIENCKKLKRIQGWWKNSHISPSPLKIFWQFTTNLHCFGS